MNFHQKPVTYVKDVGLKVLDLKRMVEFYRDVIGFNVHSWTEKKAILGAGDNALLTLETAEGLTPKDRRYAGLYHFAVLLPDRKTLGQALIHLYENGIELGSSDHLVSEALYLSDPEGNGIEIYADRDPAVWKWRGTEVEMAVDPIDAESLVLEARQSGKSWSGLPAGTVIGHIHLHVSDLSQARSFYVEGLGFEVVAAMSRALFLSEGKYHHHIGMNTWNGTGIPALPDTATGLSYYTLLIENEEKRQAIAARLKRLHADIEEYEHYIEAKDPSGNKIRLTVN